jgi:hypothetical protein
MLKAFAPYLRIVLIVKKFVVVAQTVAMAPVALVVENFSCRCDNDRISFSLTALP